MAAQNYTMREYTVADLADVARLQRQLLGDNVELNLAYLRWKYHDNPQDTRPWAVVAEHDEDGIVGFRGFIPSRWRDGRDGQEVPLLALADTCVDRNHRRRGLFSGMTREALVRFADAPYRAIINLSTSPRPAPGYVKMGWQIFGYHGQRVRLTWRGLWHRAFPAAETGPAGEVRRRRGDLDCALETAPRPAEMAAVVAAAPDAGRLTLRRDEQFYAWRFGNGRESYRFAYARRQDSLVAFLVVRDDQAPGSGAVIDYAETEPGGLRALTGLLLGSGSYGTLSVWVTRPHSADGGVWRRRGFRSLAGVKRLVGRAPEAMPLLIRPLAVEPAPADWLVNGRDLRDPLTWNIMEICSDGA